MTDFDTRIMEEESEPPVPLAPEVEPEDRGRRQAAAAWADARAPAEGVDRSGEPAIEPVASAAPEQRAPEQHKPQQHQPQQHRPDQRSAQGDATEAERSAADSDVRRRRRLLAAAVVALTRAPEDLALQPMFAAYERATGPEIQSAARLLLGAYLGAGTETRRRARPQVSAQLTRAERSRLAVAFAGQLGAVAEPPASPPPRAPTPPDGDGAGRRDGHGP